MSEEELRTRDGESRAHEGGAGDASAETLEDGRAKAVFLAHIRHELRTPTDAIIG